VRPYKFVIKRSVNGQWMFNIVAGNGEIVATSEQYRNRADALKTVRRIKYMSLVGPIKTEEY